MACHHWISVCAEALLALARTAAVATDDKRIRVIVKSLPKNPADVSTDRKTAICPFYCCPMTVRQDCVKNRSPSSEGYQDDVGGIGDDAIHPHADQRPRDRRLVDGVDAERKSGLLDGAAPGRGELLAIGIDRQRFNRI